MMSELQHNLFKEMWWLFGINLSWLQDGFTAALAANQVTNPQTIISSMSQK